MSMIQRYQELISIYEVQAMYFSDFYVFFEGLTLALNCLFFDNFDTMYHFSNFR